MRISAIIADIIQIINRQHHSLQGLGDDDHTHYFLADGSRAMGGDLDLAGNDLITTNLRIGEESSSILNIKNRADNARKSLMLESIYPYGSILFSTTNQIIAAPDIPDAVLNFQAKRTGATLISIATLRGGTTPTFDLGSGRLTGDLNANGLSVVGLKAPVAAADAARKDTHRTAFNAYSDVTGSRAFGTIYQNTTGKTMIVLITCELETASTGTSAKVTALVEDATPPTDNLGYVQFLCLSNDGNNYHQSTQLLTIIVPNGYYYKAFAEIGGIGSATVMRKWIEIVS